MKKQLRKIALAVVFAMAVSMIAPTAQVAEAAAKKEFTYAEQNTGDAVTTLVMDKGDKVDLKFKGVPDYKNYKLKWASSDTKVAVVDSAGVITAVGKGVARIQLTIGDGSNYTSKAVVVYVETLEQKVTIGTASKAEITSYTMAMGESVVLKANGLLDNIGGRYTCDWSSTVPGVAKISDAGVVTPVAPGLTVIQLTVTKKDSGETMEATPIALLVTGKDTSTPVATATPVPTTAPDPTKAPATPTPTPVVIVTPNPTQAPELTVTPAPEEEYVPYAVVLEADNCLLLKFTSAVDYDSSDITLYKVENAGSSVVEVKWELLNVERNDAGTEIRLTPIISFENGKRYIVKAGSADPGRTVNVTLGAPNQIVVSYECLGKSGVAYAYDEEIAIDVPVTLSYRLKYGNVDVTETYKDRGLISYELVSGNEEYVSVGDDTLHFFEPNVNVRLLATYTYYDDNGNPKDVKTTVNMKSSKLPAYSIYNRIVNWTIIDTESTEKIDWSKPVQQVVSGTKTAKLVVMISDSYGNYYVTDDRGVDKANKIYSMYDYEQLFSQFGYGIEFTPADASDIIVHPDGSLYPFKALNQAVTIVTLTDTGYSSGNYSSRNIGICPIKVLAESKLSTITAEETKVTLAGEAMPGFEERFCTTDVEIILKDQYGNAWNGAYNLELSSKYTDVNSALSSYYAPASLDGTTLHIDVQNLKAAGVERASFPITVTETTTKRSVTVTVTVQKPALSNGSINIAGWSLEQDNTIINLGEATTDSVTQFVTLEALQMTSNNVKVGLFSDLYVLDKIDHKFTLSNCEVGDIYVLVIGPDGQPVQEAADASSLGVYVDKANSCIRVNVSAPTNDGTMALESLEAGKYTIRATRITSMGSSVPRTAVLTKNFTVKDNTKNITFHSLKSKQTSLTVSGSNDQAGIKAVVESLFLFNIDGKLWKDMTADMISSVNYVINGDYVVVIDVEFAVPVESDAAYTMTYKKRVEEINKSVRVGVGN